MYYNTVMVTTAEFKKNSELKLPPLPLDIQFFDKIINNGFLYVDKTGFIAKLIDSKLTYFFLSRPRKFGKSLLVSTMKEIFSGNKKLFKNLEIYDQVNWKAYPVIHFDFTLVGATKDIPVEKALADEVDKMCRDFNLPITKGNHKSKFRFLIENLSKKKKKPVAGYTEEELLKYFYLFIQKFAVKESIRFDEMLHHIRKWYNGYSWDGHTRVYNPYSILKLFAESNFSSHWYSTGTPTFLIQTIRQRKMKIQELDYIKEKKTKLENMEVTRLELIPLLFQTGYLTIIEKISKSIAMEEYIMGYPNRDVRYSFLNRLLEDFSPGNPRLIDNITDAVIENRVDDMLENMKDIFAAVPFDHFDPTKEASYHSLTHAIFYLILDNIGAEIHTNRGIIDEVIETDRYVYIFEFKMEDAQAAMDQIHQKKYYEKYRIKGKEIVLVGVSFSKEERNIKEWIIEAL
jgi:hypothetical protein